MHGEENISLLTVVVFRIERTYNEFVSAHRAVRMWIMLLHVQHTIKFEGASHVTASRRTILFTISSSSNTKRRI